MSFVPNPKAWAEHVDQCRLEGRIMMGTTADHQLGDISRDEPDYFYVEGEDEASDSYVGRWLTGFGFIDVKFPKGTVRDMTDEEFEFLRDHPVVIG